MYDRFVSERAPLRLLVFSDDASVRARVISALAPRPLPDLPGLEFVEVATEPVVFEHLDAGDVDLVVLDGEAAPAGGMGIARQMKDEVFGAPPVVLLTGRPQDAWLATWSRAEAVVPQPLDPFRLAEAVVEVARGLLARR